MRERLRLDSENHVEFFVFSGNLFSSPILATLQQQE